MTMFLYQQCATQYNDIYIFADTALPKMRLAHLIGHCQKKKEKKITGIVSKSFISCLHSALNYYIIQV
jgi:hypothetical protein